jgi:hypothetical protein
MLTNQEGNDLIKKYISENKVFGVSRVGSIELCVVNAIRTGRLPTDFEMMELRTGAGYYGSCLQDYYNEYLAGIACADIQVAWAGTRIDQIQNDIFDFCSKDSAKVGNRAVEPFYFDNPWSLELKGKKVLAVSPISQTIMYQFKKMDKIWEGRNVFPEFEIETYNAVQSIGGQGPHKSWKESLDIMKDEISKINFDIAILGCGAYGLPLVAHIKNNLSRSAIYVGGPIQLFFGIKGARWERHPEISRMFNEHWRKPLDVDIPKNYYMVEGGCYW